MRLYDPYGALVIVYTMSFTLTDERYIRRNADDTVEAVTTGFKDGTGAVTFRIKNGVPQIKNSDDGLFYPVSMNNVQGYPNIYADPTAGES